MRKEILKHNTFWGFELETSDSRGMDSTTVLLEFFLTYSHNNKLYNNNAFKIFIIIINNINKII